VNINASIQWFEDRKGKVTYSMDNRRGPGSYDCSSSVYLALVQGGFFPSNIYIGNTDSLFNDLEAHGWTQLPANAQGNFDTQRGDIFIWGVRGSSSGADGHTGMFIDADNIIHCSSGYNGIAESNYDWLHQINGSRPQTFYRFTGTAVPANDPTDQIVEVGSYIKFTQPYTADDIQIFADVWQVRTNALCPVGFTWGDNGIPAAAVVEVTDDGFATASQVLDIGSKYVIPGKFEVLDVGQSNQSNWLAQISYQGLKFWIDLATVTEVAESDPGTPMPTLKPPVIPPISAPTPSPITPSAPTQQPVAPAPLPAQPTTPPVQVTNQNNSSKSGGLNMNTVTNVLKKAVSKDTTYGRAIRTIIQAFAGFLGFVLTVVALPGFDQFVTSSGYVEMGTLLSYIGAASYAYNELERLIAWYTS
jgi:hypothetical protein